MTMYNCSKCEHYVKNASVPVAITGRTGMKCEE